MVKSESIGKLAEALSKAQGEYKSVEKNCVNPFFKSKYADLSSIIDATREALSKNGLSFIQTNRLSEGGKLIIITTLMHISGEWVEGELAMTPVKADPQAGGSCLTYLRRYSLQQMLGVAAEDEDDGHEASEKGEKEKEKKPDTSLPLSPITLIELIEKIKEAKALPHLKNIWVKYGKDIKRLPKEDLAIIEDWKEKKKEELNQVIKEEGK